MDVLWNDYYDVKSAIFSNEGSFTRILSVQDDWDIL